MLAHWIIIMGHIKSQCSHDCLIWREVTIRRLPYSFSSGGSLFWTCSYLEYVLQTKDETNSPIWFLPSMFLWFSLSFGPVLLNFSLAEFVAWKTSLAQWRILISYMSNHITKWFGWYFINAHMHIDNLQWHDSCDKLSMHGAPYKIQVPLST